MLAFAATVKQVLSTATTPTVLASIPLVTFDGEKATTHEFVELNDPVMGGRSSGTWSVMPTFGVMDGEVVDVPSLQAPGFIKAAADGAFPDAASASAGALELEVRSTTPQYAGFRVSLAAGAVAPPYSCAGGGSIPLSRGCYKAKFSVPAGDGWHAVSVPFASFSDLWSPATGEHTKECSEDASACLTAKKLSSLQRVELWAEGAVGKVHLELKSVSAVPAAPHPNSTPLLTVSSPAALAAAAAPAAATTASRTATRPPAPFGTCSGAVQKQLRFGISGREQPTVPVPLPATESLAEAVCCDNRTVAYAEPRFLYQAPDIALYSRLDAGVTTFYDSVCGLPLFRAPLNRSLAAFKADTDEHGWPSFRTAEVVAANVVTDVKSGLVSSRCGTHLGSYLPDGAGPRWCMDLSCIAGAPAGSPASQGTAVTAAA